MNNLAVVLDVSSLGRNFPDSPNPEINRENYLDTIDELFSKTQIIFVNGQEGSGKTILLRQYAMLHPRNSVALFINPFSRATFNLETVTLDLINQIHWLLYQKEIDDDPLNYQKYKIDTLLWQLDRESRRNRQKYYFVIDGLVELMESDLTAAEEILKILPFNYNKFFHLLFSGDISVLPDQYKKFDYKECNLSGFTFDEARQCLGAKNVDLEQVRQLYKVMKLPGFFSSVNRQLLAGKEISEILDNIPETCADMFQLEWENVKQRSNDEIDLILAMLAFSNFPLSLLDIAKILEHDTDIEISLRNISFLTIRDNQVSFVNDAFRKFVSSKLAHLQLKSENLLITYVQSNRDKKELFDALPDLLFKTARYSDLLQLLSENVLSNLGDFKQSLLPMKAQLLLGVETTKLLNKPMELEKYLYTASIVEDLVGFSGSESEVDAYIVLNHADLALERVDSLQRNEDKLFFLSKIAFSTAKTGKTIPELADRLQVATDSMDLSILGEKAIEIASNLLMYKPDLAFTVLENSVKNNPSMNLDLALTKLYFQSVINLNPSSESLDLLQQIESRVNNPALKKFYSTPIAFINYSVDDLLLKVFKIERENEKLFILRSWLENNYETPGVLKIVELALDIATNMQTGSPSARDFRIFAKTLASSPVNDDFEKYLERFTSLTDTVLAYGPVQEYYRYRIELAVAAAKASQVRGSTQFTELILESLDIGEKELKCHVFAWLLEGINRADPLHQYEKEDYLHSLCRNTFVEVFKEIQNDSGDQYAIGIQALRAISVCAPSLAVKLAQELNTIDRREKATLMVLKSFLHDNCYLANMKFVDESLDVLETTRFIDESKYILVNSAIKSDSFCTENAEAVNALFQKLMKITSPIIKCNSLCLFLDSAYRKQICEKFVIEAEDLLSVTWSEIDNDLEKIDVGYKIIEALHENYETANNYLVKIENLKKTRMVFSDAAMSTYIAGLKLCISALSNLIVEDLIDEKTIYTLIQSIIRIPSTVNRVGCLTDLAMQFRQSNKKAIFDSITQQIKGEINAIPPENKFLRSLVINISSPAFYLYHQATGRTLLNELPFRLRDIAYHNVAMKMIFPVHNTDVDFDFADNSMKKLNYEEVKDFIDVIKEIEEDRGIYTLVKQCVDVIEYFDLLKRIQKFEIVTELKSLIETKLPNPKYIQHPGYKICCLAQVLRLEKGKEKEWSDLIQCANEISNIHDRAFILIEILECLPNKEEVLKNKLSDEIEELIAKVPSEIEQIQLWDMFLQNLAKFNLKKTKSTISAIIKKYANNSDTEVLSNKKKIFDLAHKLDPSFASSLVSLLDDDSNQGRLKSELTKDKFILDAVSTLQRTKLQKPKTDQPMTINQVLEVAERSLKSLYAGRAASIEPDKIIPFLYRTSTMPLSDSFVVHEWFLENLNQKYRDRKSIEEHIKPLFEHYFSGCELSYVVSEGIQDNKFLPQRKQSFRSGGSIVEPKTFQEYITDWVRNCVKDFLYIADPYFSMEELTYIKTIIDIKPQICIRILTSRKQLLEQKIPVPWDDTFRQWWKTEISDQTPYDTSIVVAGLTTNDLSPIHDRWWLTKDQGLRFGSSLKKIGENRVSEISEISESDLVDLQETIKLYLFDQVKTINSTRIYYSSFSL